ncbi:MAG TPA: ABC transporter substrate-binding protein [Thermodesulfobacteriota bacterium]|nr:ABC transporter substrate-binding protein [Thermodesulfobacteriota bacterium]
MRKLAIFTILVLIFSVISVSMAMAQAKKTPATKEPIRFGAIYDFVGGCYMYSESAMTGIKLAVDEINAKGGVLGRKLEYFRRDTEGKTDIGQRETKDLILREKVDFIMGPCSSGVGLAMQVIHSEYKVIRIAGIANTEAQTVDKFTPYIFQIVPNTYMEATANTRYLNKKFPKAKKFCTIGPDYEFGRREEGAFADEIRKLVPDAEILYEAWPKLGEKDFTAFITAIMAKKPDAVHGSLFGGDLVSFTKQALPYGFFEKTPFIALYDLPVLVALGPDAPEGTLGFGRGCFFMDPNPKMMEFVEKYKKANAGAYPDSWAVMAYDTLYLYKGAAEKAKTVETQAMIKALEGYTMDSLRGKFTIRPLDHMGTVPCYQGTIAKDPKYPAFKIWKDLSRIPGEQVIRPEASIREIWKKTGVVR